MSGHAVPMGAQGVPAAPCPLPSSLVSRSLLLPVPAQLGTWQLSKWKKKRKKKKKKLREAGEKPPRPLLGEFLLPKMAAWRMPVCDKHRGSARVQGWLAVGCGVEVGYHRAAGMKELPGQRGGKDGEER